MNLLFYCLSFCFILYFFSKFHRISLLKEKLKLVYFSVLYGIFIFSYNPYFDWKVWLLISLLIYCVLDDIWHKEFNILLPFFVSVSFLVMHPSVITITAILFVFVSFYAFAFILHKVRKSNESTKLKDPQKEGGKKRGSIKRFFSSISSNFSAGSGMGEGDPWIICSFLLLLSISDWIPYLIINWIMLALFFGINHFSKVKRASIPFAPILLLSLSIYQLIYKFH